MEGKETMWKIIQTDGYARETVAERLLAENIFLENDAIVMLEALRSQNIRDESVWYEIVPQDHVLWRGMEEIV